MIIIQAESMCAVAGKPLIASVMHGCNAVCLAYGQRGSGKTYTMLGAHPRGQASIGGRFGNDMEGQQGPAADSQGLMPRMLMHLFQVCTRLSCRCLEIAAHTNATLKVSNEKYGPWPGAQYECECSRACSTFIVQSIRDCCMLIICDVSMSC
jgi:hypothetical protein